MMERGSNLNIPGFGEGTLLYAAECTSNNNPQCIEWWVQLGTTLNHQGPRNMIQFSMAVLKEAVFFLFYCNIFYFNIIWHILLTAIRLTPGGISTVHIYTHTHTHTHNT